MSISEKNNAKGFYNETQIEDGFLVLSYRNDTNQIVDIERDIDSSFIQFHFCLKGHSAFLFNNGSYVLDISEESSLLLYNPQRDFFK